VTPVADLFIQVVSYCDPRLPATIWNLRHNAARRVRFGVVVDDDDEERMRLVQSMPDVDAICGDPTRARGPVYARHLAQGLWEGEPWYVSVDAHTEAVDRWDERLIGEIERIGGRTVLTNIPAPVLPFDRCHLQRITETDAEWGFGGTEVVALDTGGEPRPAAIVCCGTFIAPSSFLSDVPIDPHLDHRAEETALALRAFTHGYDLWNTGFAVFAHNEDTRRHTLRPVGIDGLYRMRRGWTSRARPLNETRRDLLATERAAILFGLEPGDLGAYGVGRARSREAYWEHCGVTFTRDTLTEHRKRRLRPSLTPKALS